MLYRLIDFAFDILSILVGTYLGAILIRKDKLD